MKLLKMGLALALLVALTACPGSSATTGSLQVTITGLPSGVDANVVVTKPGGATETLTASKKLENLAPGSYSVAANPVSGGGKTFNPSVSGSPANVTAGNTANVSVIYTEVTVSTCPDPAVFDNPLCTFDTAKFGP